MALIKCPDCGQEVSDKAASCPHCGYPLHNNPIQLSANIIHIRLGVSVRPQKVTIKANGATLWEGMSGQTAFFQLSCPASIDIYYHTKFPLCASGAGKGSINPSDCTEYYTTASIQYNSGYVTGEEYTEVKLYQDKNSTKQVNYSDDGLSQERIHLSALNAIEEAKTRSDELKELHKYEKKEKRYKETEVKQANKKVKNHNKVQGVEDNKIKKEKNSEDNMMFCTWCGERIPRNSQYCSYCGKKVTYIRKIDNGGVL